MLHRILSAPQKLLEQWTNPWLLYRGVSSQEFPQKSVGLIRIAAKLRATKSSLLQRNIAKNLGSLYTLPHPLASKTHQYFIEQNPNHLGQWADTPPGDQTQQLEYEVIQKMMNLYRAKSATLDGYITSGATEGNIFSVWLGRSALEKQCAPHTICLMLTSLTHYSIRKASALCGVPHYVVPIGTDTWSMHAEGLRKSIEQKYKEGMRGFLIPLTMGYTSTGTSDDIAITRVIGTLQKLYKHIYFFVWIDAALNGLITPFIQKNYAPFDSRIIQSYVVDFHKFGQVPYPAGIILYKKKLRQLIEKPIDYLEEKDSTLLGSRGGVPAASIWTMIHYFGKNKYKKSIQNQLANKQYFIDQLRQIMPGTKIITQAASLTCGLIFQSLTRHRLPKLIEKNYSLNMGETDVVFYPHIKRRLRIYKIFFLPHMTRSVVTQFIKDLQRLTRTNKIHI